MSMKKLSARTLAVAGAVALSLGGMSSTQAAVDDLDVSATVVANCTITANALDLGDWVGASGTVMRTRRGELSVKVRDFTLLAMKCDADVAKWVEAARASGLPLTMLDISGERAADEARDVYGAELALVRPDQHVAWRGRSIAGLAYATATGMFCRQPSSTLARR